MAASPSGCWEWTGSDNGSGYGVFYLPGRETQYVHRLAYEDLVGPIPDGLHIDHLCRNRRCVNPDHLEPVTNRTNVLRGVGVTAKKARQTHCKRGHALTGANVYVYPSRPRERECRTCKRLLRRRWLRARRASSANSKGGES